MMERIAEASPRLKARIAGALNLLSLLTAAFTELFVRSRLNIAGGLIAIVGMVAVTLLVYDLFKPVNRSLSLLAAFFSLVALTFEALRWQPQGICRVQLPADRLPHFQVNLSASNSGRADGVWRFGLADLYITGARKLSVPLQSLLRHPRARIGDAVAPRDGRERSTMEGAGQRSGAVAIIARYSPDSVTS
jgi:hypothetical protein